LKKNLKTEGINPT